MEEYVIKTHPCGALPPEFDRLNLALDRLLPSPSAQNKREREIDLMLEYFGSSVSVSLDEHLLAAQIKFQKNRIVEIQRQASAKKREVRQQCDEISDRLIKNLEGQITDEVLDTDTLNRQSIRDRQAEAKMECDRWIDTQVGKIEARTQTEIAKYHAEIDDWQQLEIDICEREIAFCQVEIEAIASEPQLFPSPSRVKSGANNHSSKKASASPNGNGNGSYRTSDNGSNGSHDPDANGSNGSNGNGVNPSAPPPPQTNPPNSVGNAVSQGADPSPRQARTVDDRWRAARKAS